MKTTIAFLFFLTGFSATALAGGTSHWVHTSEADFRNGTFDNVVATNLGDLKLSRATRVLLSQDPRISAVYTIAEAPDGTVYAGTGPQGVLLRVRAGKVETATVIAGGTNLTAVVVEPDGRVLTGTAGEKGQIVRIDPARPDSKPQVIFEAEGVQYVWAMLRNADGMLYAATGPNGQLFEIRPDGSNRVLLDTGENNLTSLAADGKDFLFVGSDPNGHVYRVNRKSGEMFVLYDAAESEISALAVDSAGNVYAGTGQSTGGTMEEEAAESAESGRPETAGGRESPIPSDTPKLPEPNEPPKLPLPGPGEPPPIPSAGDGARAPGDVPVREPKKLAMDVTGAPGDGEPEPDPAPPGHGEPASPTVPSAATAAMQQAPPAISARGAGEPAEGGNAIYRIDPQGFVTEIFRQNVLVLSMLEHDGVLLVGTGSEGMVYQIDPAADETVVVAKLDAKEVLAITHARDGQLYLGLANDGQVATMSDGFAGSGTFVGPVLDAAQSSRFGKLSLRGSLPEGTALTVSTRSGNVRETAAGSGWSAWAPERAAAQFVTIESPPARFFQYRLTFRSEKPTQSPAVDEVDVAYLVPNVGPAVKAVTVGAGSSAAADLAGEAEVAVGSGGDRNPVVSVAWEASDANRDTLRYSLFYRTIRPRGEWILLKGDLSEASFDWNTRTVADGRYQVKVVASDAGANPVGEGKSAARVSDPLVVDNTPPQMGDLTATPGQSDGRIGVRANVVDRTSTVSGLEFTVDGASDWRVVRPVDKIADSPEEAYEFQTEKLSPGAHQITLRATDAKGNRSFETVTVTVR